MTLLPSGIRNIEGVSTYSGSLFLCSGLNWVELVLKFLLCSSSFVNCRVDILFVLSQIEMAQKLLNSDLAELISKMKLAQQYVMTR